MTYLYRQMLKRTMDVIVSGLGMLAISPVIGFCAMFVKWEDGGAVFYQGPRVGLGGGDFVIFKFRTMTIGADKIGGTSTADDDPRITQVGAALRRWKLDEIPQLWNVLKGDMSLVGPRPQVRHDVDKYTNAEQAILSVRPGITDWSSIRFRNEGEILKGRPDPDQAYIELIRPEKLRLQLHYVRNRSLSMDLKIIWATILALAGREVKLP